MWGVGGGGGRGDGRKNQHIPYVLVYACFQGLDETEVGGLGWVDWGGWVGVERGRKEEKATGVGEEKKKIRRNIPAPPPPPPPQKKEKKEKEKKERGREYLT